MSLFFGILALLLLALSVYMCHCAVQEDRSGFAVYWAILGVINFFSAIMYLTAAGSGN